MLHNDLLRAPQLASPLLETPYWRRVKVFLELLFSATANVTGGSGKSNLKLSVLPPETRLLAMIVKLFTWLSMQSKQSLEQLAWWLPEFFPILLQRKLVTTTPRDWESTNALAIARLVLEATFKSREKQRGIGRSQINGGNAPMTNRVCRRKPSPPVAPMLPPTMRMDNIRNYVKRQKWRP